MKTLAEHTLDRAIKYHKEHEIPIYENIFRTGTSMHFELIEKVKEMYLNNAYEPIDNEEREILDTDIGEWDLHNEEYVPLDYPMFKEEKEPELNSPKRGGRKKFYVYVRDPQTKKVRKIEWGDTTGLKMKISNPEARKSFAARHRCDQQNDKMSAAYWMCRTPRYGKQLGLSSDSTGSFFW
jgi:hypothetical protein